MRAWRCRRSDVERSPLNPLALVPVLTEGNLRLSQSPAILEYLDERYPLPPLLPLIDRGSIKGPTTCIDNRLRDPSSNFTLSRRRRRRGVARHRRIAAPRGRPHQCIGFAVRVLTHRKHVGRIRDASSAGLWRPWPPVRSAPPRPSALTRRRHGFPWSPRPLNRLAWP